MLKLFDPQQPLEVKKAISEVLKSGRFVKGPKTEEFERVWAKRCGMKYAIGVSSGAMALELAIQATDKSRITYTPHTFRAVPNAIRRMGRTPVACNDKPILYAHHLHDSKPDYKPLIEDCSHCHGYKPFADTAIFSLFPTKILGACGDAGVIVTNDKTVHEKCLELRSHKGLYATNARMDEIQAAALLAKLPYLDGYIKRRREIVAMYDEGLGRKTEGIFHYAYCIEGSEEKKLKLLADGIETSFYYTEKYMALPLNPFLTNQEIKRVIRCVSKL